MITGCCNIIMLETFWFRFSLLSFYLSTELCNQSFCPEKILMLPETGRVYHPGPSLCGGVGLIADKLSILWTQEQRFLFTRGENNPPSGFIWNNQEYTLDQSLLELVRKDKEKGIGFQD